MSKKSYTSHAFTLIEVLIALLIIAIALAAAIRATNESIRTTIHVQNSVAAHWVGLNILSEIQTGMITLPRSSNTLQGKTKMLNHEWQWSVQIDPSEKIKGLTRMTVAVSLKDHIINSVTGFILTGVNSKQ